MSYFIGVDGVAKEVSNIAVGVDGVARNVKVGYIGVDGKARQFFSQTYKPSLNETIVSLSEGQTFNSDTVFAPGLYEVQISGKRSSVSTWVGRGVNCFTIQTRMTKRFKIVGITSTSATDSFLTSLGITSQEGTIFGGSGGGSAYSGPIIRSVVWKQGALNYGGACCHFLPANGVFGTDYLRCFHCGADGNGDYGGSGAYGGGAGGRGSKYTGTITRIYTGATGYSGAGGAGGAGGTGSISGNTGSGVNGKAGNNGSGIGLGSSVIGGVAWYDGTQWLIPTRSTNSTDYSYLRVIYRGE